MKWDNWNYEVAGYAAPTQSTSTAKPARRRSTKATAAPDNQPEAETLGRWESEGGPDPDAIVEPEMTDLLLARVGAARMAITRAIDVVRKRAGKVKSGDHDGSD